MKALCLTAAVWTAWAAMVHGQPCETYVGQGRTFLVQSNLLAANSAFAQAVASCPTHQTGNVFNAITRLLTLPSLPTGSNFLNRLGLPSEGRNLYQWTAEFPRTANGAFVLPADGNVAELVGQARSNLLPQITGALANLARVTDTNFTLTLSSNETQLTDVTLDYADVQMLRAMLHAAEYMIYLVHSCDANLAVGLVQDLSTNRPFPVEQMLRQYPHLLEFSGTDERGLARGAFTNGVACYLVASERIRQRPLDRVCLFNPDREQATGERQFRDTLVDLVHSLDAPATLRQDPNYTVNLAQHFAGSRSVRSLLPRFVGGAIRAGSLPDPTFGGIISGLGRGEIELWLSEHFTMVPWLGVPVRAVTGELLTRLHTVAGHSYALLATDRLSPDGAEWAVVDLLLGTEVGTLLANPPVELYPNFFVAAVESDRPVNDSFAERLALVGSTAVAWGSTAGASWEMGEPDTEWFGPQSVWWTWTAPASGYVRCQATRGELTAFAGDGLETLRPVETNYVSEGTVVHLRVATFWDEPGVFQLTLELLPPPANDRFAAAESVTGGAAWLRGRLLGGSLEAGEPGHGMTQYGSPLDSSIWWMWTAPASGRYLLSTLSGGSDIRFAVYAGSALAALVPLATNCQYGGAFDAAAGGTYRFAIVGDAANSDEIVLTLERVAIPANDNYANRQTLTGVPVTVSASNWGATRENGSNPAPPPWYTGNSSLWWAWTAPSNGVLVASTERSDFGTRLAVYSGTAPNLIALDSSSSSEGVSRLGVPVTQGQVLSLSVEGLEGARGTVVLRLWMEPLVANDAFAARLGLTGSSVTGAGTTLGATAEPGEPAPQGGSARHSVWWTWTPPSSGSYVLWVETEQEPGLALAVYEGNTLSNLSDVASGWFGPETSNPMWLDVQAGVPYALAVDGLSAPGPFTLRIEFVDGW